MVDIGELRREFTSSIVDSLLRSKFSSHEAAVNIYSFATRQDMNVSTLAVSCQVVRELRAREQQGEVLTVEAQCFVEMYDRCRREGRSIDVRPPSKKDGQMVLSDAALAPS